MTKVFDNKTMSFKLVSKPVEAAKQRVDTDAASDEELAPKKKPRSEIEPKPKGRLRRRRRKKTDSA